MPITIEYNRKDNIIYSKAEGLLNIDDLISYFSSVAQLYLKKGYGVFADYSDASLELSNEDIHRMVEARRKLQIPNEIIRIAVLTKGDMVFALGRMYEMLLGEESYNVMIFRSQEKAKEWLGISKIIPFRKTSEKLIDDTVRRNSGSLTDYVNLSIGTS